MAAVRKTSARIAKLAAQFARMTVAERAEYAVTKPMLIAKAIGSLAASALSQVK